GQFLAYSVFGRSGGARSRSEQGESDTQAQPHHAPPSRDTEVPPQDLFQFRLPQQGAVQADEIKRSPLILNLTNGGAAPSPDVSSEEHLRHTVGQMAQANRATADENAPFLERYPHATAALGSDAAQDRRAYDASQDKVEQVLAFQTKAAQAHALGRLSDQDYAAARRAASQAFHAEFDGAARDYAEGIARDPNLTMQEKYDRIHGLGGRVIALGQRSGIDYFPGTAARTTAEADAAMQRHGIFDPSRPARVYVDEPGKANEPLRALLNLRPDEDLRSRMLNPEPGRAYVAGKGELIDSEPWRDRFNLVGQIVQQQDVMNVVAGVVAQRSLAGAEALSGMGRDPDPSPYSKHVEAHSPWIARNDVALNRVEGVLSAAGFAKDVYMNMQDDYITVDVFASKTDPSERWFQVRTFEYRSKENSFIRIPPTADAPIVDEIIDPDRH
ncbi:hypothetical protein, partial [Lysobacter panacisoli]|uniref:hypothetical protein n=1 Tax=Lysobacter panacisoli TaxID=1255263 RepID=UPI0031EC5AF4